MLLGLDLHLWEQLMLVSLGIAALAVVAVVLSTFSVVRLTRAENEASKERTAELETEIARSHARADEANAAIAEAQARAAEANQKAEEERLARIKIEERLAPRSLSGEQQLRLFEAVKDFAPQPFQFTSYQDDQEVRGLLFDIGRVLLMAGWKGRPPQDFLLAGLVEGVIVELATGNAESFRPAAEALASALNAESIKASVAINP